MFATVNVTVGAFLGIVLALSPAFSVQSPADLGQPLVFVVLILLITGNIHGATDSLGEAQDATFGDKSKYYVYFVISILMFVFIQMMIILCYTSLFATGAYQNFANVRYVWLFVIITCVWFVFGILATLYDRGFRRR
jgi:preprotein translocase subunit SecG